MMMIIVIVLNKKTTDTHLFFLYMHTYFTKRFFDRYMTIRFLWCCFGCHPKDRKVNYYCDVHTIDSFIELRLNMYIYIHITHVSCLLLCLLTNQTRLENAHQERDNEESEWGRGRSSKVKWLTKQLIVKNDLSIGRFSNHSICFCQWRTLY